MQWREGGGGVDRVTVLACAVGPTIALCSRFFAWGLLHGQGYVIHAKHVRESPQHRPTAKTLVAWPFAVELIEIYLRYDTPDLVQVPTARLKPHLRSHITPNCLEIL